MTVRKKPFLSPPQLVKPLRAVLISSAIAALILVGYPWLQTVWKKLSVTAAQVLLPGQIWILALISGTAAIASIALVMLPRVWKSLRLGLLSPTYQLWITALTVFGILICRHHYLSAILILLVAGCLTFATRLLRRRLSQSGTTEDPIDPDLPVGEDGTDLLSRTEIINGLASIVLREQPSVVALIGGYGDGKTSLLNLTVGKLKKMEEHERPLIVKFSPWLPANSNALVISLLSSIVAEIRKSYVMPGLSQGALLYARALLTIVPKAKVMEAFLNEPSQEERVRRMAQQISYWMFNVFADFKNIIEEEQKYDPSYYRDFSKLIEQLRKIERAEGCSDDNPSLEDVEEFWEDEVAAKSGMASRSGKKKKSKRR